MELVRRQVEARVDRVDPRYAPTLGEWLDQWVAVFCGEDGSPLQGRRRAPGAQSVAMTLDLYGHVLPEMDEDAAERIGAQIG